MHTWRVGGGITLAFTITGLIGLGAQQDLQLPMIRDAGQSVTPAYEGWFQNADGTYSLSFGYFNRNAEEHLDIPIGPDNFIEPGEPDQGQPTHFLPRRNWGVFTVTVPEDFGDREVVWTLVVNGQTFAIPGHLNRDWMIDALLNGTTGATPATLRFKKTGPEGAGPAGITADPKTATVGTPLTLTAWAATAAVGANGRARRVALTWNKHRGPGVVEFERARVGIKLYPKGYVPDHIVSTRVVSNRELIIPPGDPNARSDAYFILQEPATLISFQPHMHYRGKRMTLEAISQRTGRAELLSDINRFAWDWQPTYVYEEPLVFAAGTVMHVTAYHDNSAANRVNPDPTAAVGWGQRTIDEMNIGWLDFFYMTDDEYAAMRKD